MSEFSKLFAKEQQVHGTAEHTDTSAKTPTPEPEPTECLIYGYASKASEWKVLSRYESVAAPGIIIEDYSREDPALFLHSNPPFALSTSSPRPRQRLLPKAAVERSQTYRGGAHWIKITFDSYEAAERACFYAPLEIDGYAVHCELWQGKPPVSDAAVPISASDVGKMLSTRQTQTLGPANGKKSALAGFEQALQNSTLPRNHAMPDAQYLQPRSDTIDRTAQDDSETASSATATSPPPTDTQLRSRSTPNLPTQMKRNDSQYMTHIPSVRKAVLKPAAQALPPQQSSMEKLIMTIPLLPWILGMSAPGQIQQNALQSGASSDPVVQGLALKADGSWDERANGWYWRLWYTVDRWLGTDYCGLKED